MRNFFSIYLVALACVSGTHAMYVKGTQLDSRVFEERSSPRCTCKKFSPLTTRAPHLESFANNRQITHRSPPDDSEQDTIDIQGKYHKVESDIAKARKICKAADRSRTENLRKWKHAGKGKDSGPKQAYDQAYNHQLDAIIDEENAKVARAELKDELKARKRSREKR